MMSDGNSKFSDDNQELPQQNNFLSIRFSQIFDQHPKLNADGAFYFEYCKMYLRHLQLQAQIQQTQQYINKIKGNNKNNRKNRMIDQSHSDYSNSDKKKRMRRTANEIARHYTCSIQKCQKSYGSEGSLNQHIKIKHGELCLRNHIES